jgi:D-glycero-D-manno-heptose 1,7-bisphosphate phosphatase
MAQRRFVILDRDGTIIVERNYLSVPDQIELIPGATNGLKELAHLKLGIVVVTNQSAVGRGLFDLERLENIHDRFRELLAAEDVILDGIYFCPHTPDDGCLCRKPRSGLVERAAKELNFDPKVSFVIGDNACDIELGRIIGATTFLVRTGYGAQLAQAGSVVADFVVEDLGEAAAIIKNIMSSMGTLCQ